MQNYVSCIIKIIVIMEIHIYTCCRTPAFYGLGSECNLAASAVIPLSPWGHASWPGWLVRRLLSLITAAHIQLGTISQSWNLTRLSTHHHKVKATEQNEKCTKRQSPAQLCYLLASWLKNSLDLITLSLKWGAYLSYRQ